MSITDPSTIDALGIHQRTGEAVLTISDHLNWDDEGGHLVALENKINAYLTFVETGQISESLPDGADRAVKISLVHKYEPTDRAVQILENLKVELAKGSVAFAYEGLPSGY
jgi:hypothetical protein